MPGNQNRHILLVEDTPEDALMISMLLGNFQFLQVELSQATTRAEAENFLKSDSPCDLILLDLSLPDSRPEETLTELLPLAAPRPVILLTASEDEDIALKAIQLGAQDFLFKGQFSRVRLEHAILYALERQQNVKELEVMRQALQLSNELQKQTLNALNQELDLARSIQRSLMPEAFMELPGLSIGFLFLPCGQVSGDLFDVTQLADGRTVVYIIDVVGHGMPAALMTTMAKLSLTKHLNTEIPLGESMLRVNSDLRAVLKKSRYITAFCGIYTADTKTFSYCQAGHPPACLIRNDSTAEWLESGAPPFGLFDELPFPVIDCQLNPGDRVHLYTDGISELQNDDGKMLGNTGLADLLRHCQNAGDEYSMHLLDHLSEFQGFTPRQDDLTMLYFEVK